MPLVTAGMIETAKKINTQKRRPDDIYEIIRLRRQH